ncbi:hypothetical protein VE04_09488, partial [Pseudogymnoascus sp. 24MN13]
MPGQNWSVGWTVHLYNSTDPNNTIGGLILTNGVTQRNLYEMIEIIGIVTSELTLRDGDDRVIPK